MVRQGQAHLLFGLLRCATQGAFAVLLALLLAMTAPVARANGASVGYYWQSVTGHLALMQAAKPLQEWLDDPATPPHIRSRLQLAQSIRQFASVELKLPDNVSYRRYADLKRTAAVWNVVAAPALSLQLKTWCFPVAGCVGYKGYYSEADANQLAVELRTQDLEVSVYPVPAYSTLGKLNWLGGDPLLNTFLNYPDGEMARLIFHELAHQVAYAEGDTPFNESFATAVERLGATRWLQQHAGPAALSEFNLRDRRQREFRALTARTRQRLAVAYETHEEPKKHENRGIVQQPRHLFAIKLEAKSAIMQQMRSEYEQLKNSWGGYAGYDGWVARANNASLGAQGAYDDWVPAFEALFHANGQDFLKFYDAVSQLAKMPKDQRHHALLGGRPAVFNPP